MLSLQEKEKKMTRIRKKYTAEFKHKVALVSIKGERTMAELSQHFVSNTKMESPYRKRGISCIFR
jgi:hypothetical protein